MMCTRFVLGQRSFSFPSMGGHKQHPYVGQPRQPIEAVKQIHPNGAQKDASLCPSPPIPCSARACLSPRICHPPPLLLIRQEPQEQGGPTEGSEELAGWEKRSSHKKRSKRSRSDDDESKGDTALTENESKPKKKTKIRHVKIIQKPMEIDSSDYNHR